MRDPYLKKKIINPCAKKHQIKDATSHGGENKDASWLQNCLKGVTKNACKHSEEVSSDLSSITCNDSFINNNIYFKNEKRLKKGKLIWRKTSWKQRVRRKV